MRYPTQPALAKLLSVTKSTIKRDIRFLEDMSGVMIEFDLNKNGLYYTEPVPEILNLQVTEKEIGVLTLLEHLDSQLPGTEMSKHLRSIHKKVRRGLSKDFTYTVTDAGKNFSIRYSSESIIDRKTMDILSRALVAGKQIRLLYKKPGDTEYRPRLLEPYHFVCVNGEWFLVAYDHERKEVRRFAPIRMRNIEETGVLFKRPDDFNIDKYLENSFGIQSGDGIYDVVLRANSKAADFVREKRWRGQTKQVELPCGSVELHLTLSSLYEIERWITSYHGNIVVLGPLPLQERVLAAGQKIVCEQMKVMAEQDKLNKGA